MKKDTFISILENKTQIQQLETVELKSIIDEFSYFQTARALYLKGLKNQDSFKYNKELKQTAAHTTDRTVLFDYITTKDFSSSKKNIHQQIKEKIIVDIEPKVAILEIEKPITIAKKEIEENLEIGKPLSFTKAENFSFNQWLQLSSKKPIQRESNSASTKVEKQDAIEQFIQNNPKIEPLPKNKKITIEISENKQDDSLMTETLAKVYLEQKKFDNAIQAYRILSLKYPEKSGFFADQIKRVQILQKHKS
ncbi:hypothetical protein [Polaribacter porphyrae]|uniref:Tetratricopeptide repeat protein n=1 Tax=Polaribacter porphyrae TaxID=1137780 RepID=A0A2S7WSF4_9FLAO|nr:hypothetical protein [Polaribacter porphyrae]PQJ80525.1 hypothetical protein BTO18_15680 [Polaribacter porphyrae]